MTDSPRRRDDERAITCAVFKYGVIAELVERDDFGPGEVVDLVREIATRTHYQPGRGSRRVAERTVWAWLAAYRSDGLDGLLPTWRSDRGTSRAIRVDLLERAVALRKDQSARTTKTILDLLRLEGRLAEVAPHRSTFDRHLAALGASRKHLHTRAARVHIKMRFGKFGALWVGDFHHGPIVLGPDGKPTTAKLGAYIDHCTRWPVADGYYPGEDLHALRDCMFRALLVWGPPEKAYTDRGKVFMAEQLAWSLDRIGAKLVHSKPYYSEGRGVIERWWQHAVEFEAEVSARPELVSLHELNRLWEAWRTLRYCNQVHSDIGRTPADAIAEIQPRPIDPAVARELFLIRITRTVHRKDMCVSVDAAKFLCDRSLSGQRVQVRYNPRDMRSVLIYSLDGHRLQEAFPQPINATPEPHAADPEPPSKSSVDYLGMLREEFDRKLLEHAQPLRYATLHVEPVFDASAFTSTVADLAGLTLRDPDRLEVSQFWATFGPIPESLVRIAVEHAVRLNGRGRHPRVYLNAIRTLVLAHWKKPEESS